MYMHTQSHTRSNCKKAAMEKVEKNMIIMMKIQHPWNCCTEIGVNTLTHTHIKIDTQIFVFIQVINRLKFRWLWNAIMWHDICSFCGAFIHHDLIESEYHLCILADLRHLQVLHYSKQTCMTFSSKVLENLCSDLKICHDTIWNRYHFTAIHLTKLLNVIISPN